MEKKTLLRVCVLFAFVASFVRIFHGAGNHELIVIDAVEQGA